MDLGRKKNNVLVWLAGIFCMLMVSLYYTYQNPVFIVLLVSLLVLVIVMLIRIHRKNFSERSRMIVRDQQATKILAFAKELFQQTNYSSSAHNAHYALYLFGQSVKTSNPEIASKQNEALQVLHNSCVNLKDYVSAIKYGDELLRYLPNEVELLCSLAYAKMQVGLREAARAHLRAALSLNPEHAVSKQLLEKLDASAPVDGKE